MMKGLSIMKRYTFLKKRTELYVAIGTDLTEVFFKPVKSYIQSPLVDYADNFFRYYQAPGTYLSTAIHERHAPY